VSARLDADHSNRRLIAYVGGVPRELPVPPALQAPQVSPARPRVGPGAAVGVTEAMIGQLVGAFYARIREDEVLGPIFNRAIAPDQWPAHEAKLCDFWSSVLLMTGRFKGSPMAAHARWPGIQDEHFERWLDLFARTAAETWPAPAAMLVGGRAEMIGQSLRQGMAVIRGALPPAHERLTQG
jgi:hemoglobin